MSSTIRRVVVTLAAVLAGASLIGTPVEAAVPSAKSEASGNVSLTLEENVQANMFKAGVFIYDANAVTVGMGSSGILSVKFQVDEAAATTVITAATEGGASIYNGPAVTSVGLGVLVVHRTGTTGTVKGKIIGTYDAATGTQYSKTLTVFTMSSAKVKASGKDWTMDANLTLTKDAANILNSQLKTKVFKAGSAFGTMSADVTGS